MTPPAPPRFSISTFCPSWSCSAGATLRVTMSVPPPGAAGTIRRIALFGYCAQAGAAEQAQARRRMARRKLFMPASYPSSTPALKSASGGNPMTTLRTIIGLALAAAATLGFAQGYPAPQEGTWTARDFRFHTGEVLPEVKLHYRTVGSPRGEPVVVLHGTTQSGAALLNPAFAGELFGAGQALDASRYYVILPDSVGHGKSSKPSDGLRAKFPRYNYDDMVDLHRRLVTEGLGVKRLRLLIGNSMGGMEIWIWAQKYPRDMDIAVPMAATPPAMASRNWITRRLIVDSIRNDPAWM